MKTEELLKKWKKVLDYDSPKFPKVEDSKREQCAIEMEEMERKYGHLFHNLCVDMVMYVRAKHSNPDVCRVEHLNGIDFVIQKIFVEERVPSDDKSKDCVEREVEWALPILEDVEDYEKWRVDIHVFGGGYFDGRYNHVPKYGKNWEDIINESGECEG